MSARALLLIVGVVLCATVALAQEDRWYNFAEDSDLRYYLDRKSMISRPDQVYIFWVKSVAKNRDFYKRQYNINDLSYLLTSYEMDCADGSYRVRQIVMLDKNRRELNKTHPAGSEAGFEPIPPESILELAQETVCPVQVGSEEPVEPVEPEPEELESRRNTEAEISPVAGEGEPQLQ